MIKKKNLKNISTKSTIKQSENKKGNENDGAWSRPLYRPKQDRKPKSNEDFYYY